MKTVYLNRKESTMLGTAGVLSFNNMTICQTLELPNRQNIETISCIPLGSYICIWVVIKKFGGVYMLTNVPNRSGILMHSGNFAGATDIGLNSDVRGCILFASNVINNGTQLEAINSKIERIKFEDFLNKETFLLVII
jgi:hypothetical protein